MRTFSVIVATALVAVVLAAPFSREVDELAQFYEEEPAKPLYSQQGDLYDMLLEQAPDASTVTSPSMVITHGQPFVPHRPVPGVAEPASSLGSEEPVSTTSTQMNGVHTSTVTTVSSTRENNPYDLPSKTYKAGAKAVLGVREYNPDMDGQAGKYSPSIPQIAGKLNGYIATKNSYHTASVSSSKRAETSVEINEGEKAAAEAAMGMAKQDALKSQQAAVAEAQDTAAIFGKKYQMAYKIDVEAQKQVRIAKAAAEKQHKAVIRAKNFLIKQEKILRFDDKVVSRKEKEELQARLAGQSAGIQYKNKQEYAMRKYKMLNDKIHHIAEMKRFQQVATKAVRAEEAQQAAAEAAAAAKVTHSVEVKKASHAVKHAASHKAKKAAKKVKHAAKKKTCKYYAAQHKNCPDKFLPSKDKKAGGSTKYCAAWAKAGYCKPIKKATKKEHGINAKARFMKLYCAGSCK